MPIVNPPVYESWDIILTIGGVDFSNKLIGSVSVDYQEDSAAIADFAIVPDAGAIDIMSWMNQVVVIAVSTNNGSQTLTSQRYKGYVMDADYDPEARIMYFSATNDLQGYFEAMTKDQINTAFGGINNPNADQITTYSAWWSPFFFNKDVTGWEYAQDLLSTTPVTMYLDHYMRLRFVPYKAETTPHLTFQDNSRFQNTLKLTRATRRDLINNVDINVDYINYKLRERIVQYTVDFDYNVCEVLNAAAPWLLKEHVYDAVESLSWNFVSEPIFTEAVSDSVWCTYWDCVGGFWAGCWALGEVTATGASIRYAKFSIYKHWALTSKEQYTINVKSQDSFTRNGNFRVALDVGVESQFDTTFWENEPLEAIYPGDYEYDTRSMSHEGNKTDLDIAQRTAINHARVSILSSHRKNYVDFTVPFNHNVRLDKTIQVEADYLTAKGKVSSYRETFDFETGAAAQEIQIALSVHGGTGVSVNTPIAPVDNPTTDGYTFQETTATGKELYQKNGTYRNSFYYRRVPTYFGGWRCTDLSLQAKGANIDGYYTNTTLGGSRVGTMYEESKRLYCSNPLQAGENFDTVMIGQFDNERWPLWENTGLIIHTDEISGEELLQPDLGASGNYDLIIPEDTLVITA